MHRAGELALEHGGIPAFLLAGICGAIGAIVTPFNVHHHYASTSLRSSLCPGGVCTSHLNTTTFNQAWLDHVVLGVALGAVLGFLLAMALRRLGSSGEDLGLPNE